MFEAILNAEVLQTSRTILDIAVLSIIFYFVYRLFRAVKIPLLINQILIIFIIYIVASLLGLDTVLWIFRNIIGWVIIGLLLIFQPELRALVMRTDYATIFRRAKQEHSVLPNLKKLEKVIHYLIGIRRGALFVFPRRIDLEHIITSKVEINADMNTELLQTIFSHDTLLHDGAVIIHNNRVTHAGCFLPTDRSGNILPNLGSRHRAAIGLSQNSDALVLVLSEEFGSVSLVFDGEILYDIGMEKSFIYIEHLLQGQAIDMTILDDVSYGHAQEDGEVLTREDS